MRMSSRRLIGLSITLLILPVFAASCRFKLPSAAEGQEFKNSGTFSSEVPAWVNQNRDKAPQLEVNSGVQPSTAGVSPGVRQSRVAVPSAASSAERELGRSMEERRAATRRADENAKALGEGQADSSLDDERSSLRNDLIQRDHRPAVGLVERRGERSRRIPVRRCGR